MNEKKIAEYMKKYEISREEAIEAIRYDEETDHMTMKEINATLTDEQKKAVKSSTKTSSAKKETVKKERKPNEEKREIIQNLLKSALELDENAKIVNVEKEIVFTIGENNYSISLICHRNAKKS